METHLPVAAPHATSFHRNLDQQMRRPIRQRRGHGAMRAQLYDMSLPVGSGRMLLSASNFGLVLRGQEQSALLTKGLRV